MTRQRARPHPRTVTRWRECPGPARVSRPPGWLVFVVGAPCPTLPAGSGCDKLSHRYRCPNFGRLPGRARPKFGRARRPDRRRWVVKHEVPPGGGVVKRDPLAGGWRNATPSGGNESLPRPQYVAEQFGNALPHGGPPPGKPVNLPCTGRFLHRNESILPGLVSLLRRLLRPCLRGW